MKMEMYVLLLTCSLLTALSYSKPTPKEFQCNMLRKTAFVTEITNGTSMDWFQMEGSCQENNGNLVWLNDNYNMSTLATYLRTLNMDTYSWYDFLVIGLIGSAETTNNTKLMWVNQISKCNDTLPVAPTTMNTVTTASARTTGSTTSELKTDGTKIGSATPQTSTLSSVNGLATTANTNASSANPALKNDSAVNGSAIPETSTLSSVNGSATAANTTASSANPASSITSPQLPSSNKNNGGRYKLDKVYVLGIVLAGCLLLKDA